jgi:hypothetical protein
MATNLPTYARNETTVTARESDVPLADFDDGLNLGASNAPAVGVNTGNPNPKLSDWTVNTQFGVTRDPQLSMHIGGDGTTEGSDNHLGDHAVRAADYAAADINDTVHFSEADQAAAPDAVYDTVTGAINRTGQNVEIGDRVWGTVPVA